LQGEREISAGNKSLGQFNLEGIPPARRGTPQIEVMFDIDANGILHVNAKDKATGKESKITIKANSGLSEEEIARMVNDAKANEADDKKRIEQVQARNQLDTLVHSVTKSVEEHGDKIGDEKAKIEAALKSAEEVLKDQDASTEKLNNSAEELGKASQKLGEIMYADAQKAAGGAPGGEAPAGEAPSGGSSGGGKPGDDAKVVDAEFTEVKDKK
jgi:molecular chaperone DnaK